jgi:hypothetical protein
MADERPIGLPPKSDAPARDASPAAMRSARLVNLFGIVPPASNLGLLSVGPKDRRWWGFGAGVVCTAVGAYAEGRGKPWLLWTATTVYYALFVIGLVDPLWVAKIGDRWAAFGALFGKVMAYPIFAAIYFLVVTPTALLVRAFGKDPLGVKGEGATTYWTPHEPPPRESYERQF